MASLAEPQRHRPRPLGVSGVRREPERRVSSGDRALRQQQHPREHERARAPEHRSYFRERASRAALRHPQCVRIPFQACHARSGARGRARWPVRTRQRAHGDLLSQPDVACAARKVGAHQHPGYASAAAARRRARSARDWRRRQAGDGSRSHGATSQECRVRDLPRTDGPTRSRARKLRRHRQVANGRRDAAADRYIGGPPRRQSVQRPERTSRAAPRAKGAVCRHADREAAVVRAWPAGRCLRSSGPPADRPRVGIGELSLVGYHPWNREEHPFSDAEGGIMIVTKKALDRRTVLRGIGTTLALPLLDSMVPALSALRETAANPIFRLGVAYVPNGMMMNRWTPASEGAGFEFKPIMKALEPFRDRLLVLSGLQGVESEGAHARASTRFLTGMPSKLADGKDLRAGISMDQVAARALGRHTQMASIELA